MNILKNKQLIKKIGIVLLVIVVIGFFAPGKVQAASWLEKVGGSLLSAIMNFLMFIGDSVMNILQNNFISQQEVVVAATNENNTYTNWLGIFTLELGIIALVAGVLIAVPSGGVGLVAGIKAFAIGCVIAGVGFQASVYGVKGIIEGLER